MNEDFSGKFNTRLSPREEQEFTRWLELASLKKQRDVGRDLGTYDLRGLWKNGGEQLDDFTMGGHAPDTYKKPSHPTFSKESIYSVGDYEGGDWISDTEFAPSMKMLKTTHPLLKLHDYLRKYGEGVRLVLPKSEVSKVK
jgi:hypothetical protein